MRGSDMSSAQGAFNLPSVIIDVGQHPTATQAPTCYLELIASRQVPVGAHFAPRAFGALACVYLGS